MPDVTVFTKIKNKKEKKSKSKAQRITTFASPNLKKGIKRGKSISVYEKNKDKAVKNSIFCEKGLLLLKENLFLI